MNSNFKQYLLILFASICHSQYETFLLKWHDAEWRSHFFKMGSLGFQMGSKALKRCVYDGFQQWSGSQQNQWESSVKSTVSHIYLQLDLCLTKFLYYCKMYFDGISGVFRISHESKFRFYVYLYLITLWLKLNRTSRVLNVLGFLCCCDKTLGKNTVFNSLVKLLG